MTRVNKNQPHHPHPSTAYKLQTYTSTDLKLLTNPNHFFFPTPRSRTLVSLVNAPNLLNNIHGLKTSKDLISFDIYPTCHHSLTINTILHKAAQRGSFDTEQLEMLLGYPVLILGLAPELHQFLSMTPKEDVDVAIIDFLVLLHHQLSTEGDLEGLHRMEQDLEPSIYKRLRQNIGIFPDGEPPLGKRANVLEQIVQLAFLTPWRVDVWGAYITPTQLLNLRSGLAVTGHIAVAKLLKDWIIFSDVLQNVAPDWGIADALERAICQGKTTQMFSRATLISKLVNDIRSELHKLPKDIVEECLIPWLIRNECEILPSRRRLAAPLECTAAGVEFLERLEAADEDVISRLAVDRDGLSLWREWAASYGDANEGKLNLCFPLDERPWDGVRENGQVTKCDTKDSTYLLSSGSEHLDRENSLGRSLIRNRSLLP